MASSIRTLTALEDAVRKPPDARHWELRAEEARAAAESMSDPESARLMHGVARAYERLWRYAVFRETGVLPS